MPLMSFTQTSILLFGFGRLTSVDTTPCGVPFTCVPQILVEVSLCSPSVFLRRVLCSPFARLAVHYSN